MPGIVTVQTPAPSTRLTTVAAAQAEVGSTSAADQTPIGGLIDRASAVIANYCGRVFGVQAVAETFRFGWEPGVGPASQTAAPYGTPLNVQRKPLILSGSPVVEIDSVTENGTELDPTQDFEVDAASGLVFRLRSGLRSWWNVPTVVVTYSAGWLLPNDTGRNLPFDVEDACLALVRAAWFARGRDPDVAMDMLNGDRTQFWGRSVSAMALDDAMKTQLAGYVVRTW